jgi:hypothetical protein
MKRLAAAARIHPLASSTASELWIVDSEVSVDVVASAL